MCLMNIGGQIRTQKDPLYHFLTLTQGSWRNAAYISCADCPYGQKQHPGYLLKTDADGSPVIYPVDLFEQKTGDRIDPKECMAILSVATVENLFHQWLLWNVSDPSVCWIPQIL